MSIVVKAERFHAWLLSLRVAPLIVSMRQRAELGPHKQELVDALTARLVAKLLHEPTIELTRTTGGPEGKLSADAVERLFGLRAA